MAISFKQILAPAQVDDVEAAQRRQAIAEAMQQRVMQPNLPQVGGPVQAKYGAGNALVDLANSLASAWNLKNANTALGRAKEARAGQVQDASKRVAMSQPNMPMASGPGEIMSPLTPEEASADLGRAMGPEGQTAVAKALMERKLSETDPNALADRELKAYQIKATMDERRAAREDRAAMLREQIASREQMGKDANDLRRELANLTAGIQRDAERGRNERADADRKSREAVAAAKTDATAETKAQGADSLDALMAQLRSSYGVLKDSGGITSTDASGLDNAQAAVQSSAPGQFLGRVFGTKNQSERNSIAQTRPLLLAAIKDATGMSARQLDSNAELKLWLSAATDPTLDVQANVRALDNIDAFVKARAGVGTPTTNRSGTIQRPSTAQPAATPAAAPAGVDPAVWQAMTPEERALWQN